VTGADLGQRVSSEKGRKGGKGSALKSVKSLIILATYAFREHGVLDIKQFVVWSSLSRFVKSPLRLVRWG